MTVPRLLVAALIVLAACSSGDEDLCGELEGDWRSVETGAGVLTAEGEVEPAFEDLSIFEDTIDYYYADIVESGSFECSDNRLTAFNGSFEAEVRRDGSKLLIDNNGFVFELLE